MPSNDRTECSGPCDTRLWRDACGVFGIYSPGQDVARLAYFGLFSLQHRGQESAGMATGDGTKVDVFTGMGLVTQVFDEVDIANLNGDLALGHVRYSTTGGNVIQNAQPMPGEHSSGPFAVAHNGNLINARALRDDLIRQGETFLGSSDTEVIARLIARSPATTIEEAVADMMHKARGAYSLGLATPRSIIAARDPNGVRPLAIGRYNSNGWVIASETCALSTINASFVREVQPGEIVTLDDRGLRAIQAVEPERRSACIFEFIYFARPDSHIYGRSVYTARVTMGKLLAQQAPADVDMVIGIPETGIPHAIGFAQGSELPYGEGFIKNRYIHRTFISPGQKLRELGVRMKLRPLQEAIAGKRLAVVDDSIVRGTTTGPEISLLREAGVREVHLRISCPPIQWPCFYGIDTALRSELVASRLTVEGIRQHVGADSLAYLDTANLVAAVGLPKANFCTACFDNDYPIPVPPDVTVTKFDLEAEPGSEPAE